MRLVNHRQRQGKRPKGLRIAISQAEITADLHYPVGSREVRAATPAQPAGGR